LWLLPEGLFGWSLAGAALARNAACGKVADRNVSKLIEGKDDLRRSCQPGHQIR